MTEKNCKDCTHFEACSKWTDFPKQIGFPTCRRFDAQEDVAEVVHGRFVWIADDSPMCNICGKVFDTNDDADAGLWNFCPECGAKMSDVIERSNENAE